MPSTQAHLAAARRNQATIDFLLPHDDHLAWVVAVAFYKALHVVEAMFAADPKAPVKHTDDHKARHQILKTTNRYKHLWSMYRPLYEASMIARYLRADDRSPTTDVFAAYLPRPKVESLVLNHYLSSIEKSAARLVDDVDFLKR